MHTKIEKAQPADTARLAEVFNLSFYCDFVKYGECPGYGKTEQAMLASMRNYIMYKIMADEETVGAISVKQESETCFFLSALCVIPEYANQGIGQTAMAMLDAQFPTATHWALETPADKTQNHYFYRKFGYEVTREYTDGSVLVSYFERSVNPA